MTTEAALDRQHILEHNHVDIVQAHARVVRDGMRDPVIIIADLRDPYGRKIAMTSMSDADIDAMIQDFATRQCLPTVLVAMARTNVIDLVRKTHPGTANALAMPTHADLFPVLCVASGGVALVLVSATDDQTVGTLDN